MHSSTLTPMHLRKAKLMFFWVRYPSSAVLKMYFPDIKFNKNNTAQLVKWFSNFRWVPNFFWYLSFFSEEDKRYFQTFVPSVFFFISKSCISCSENRISRDIENLACQVLQWNSFSRPMKNALVTFMQTRTMFPWDWPLPFTEVVRAQESLDGCVRILITLPE